MHADSRPNVLCYSGPLTLATLFHIWDRLKFTFETTQPDFLSVHYGNSSRVVVGGQGSVHDDVSSPLYLRPYEIQCVGVEHAGGYRTPVEVKYHLHAQLEFWPVYPVLLAAGLTLLFTAPALSRSANTFLIHVILLVYVL